MSRGSQGERALVEDGRYFRHGFGMSVGSSFKAVAKSRLGRLLLAVSAVTALAAHAPALLLAPFLVALLLAARMLGRSWSDALEAARVEQVRLPDPTSFEDPRACALATRLCQARESLDAAIEAGPRGAGFDLTSALAGVPRTERDVMVLLSRFEYVARFLARNDVKETRDELLRLESRAREEAASRAVLEPAMSRCREHLEALTTLKLESERILVAAEAAVHVLEQVSADVVRLQLSRLDACDSRLAEAEPRAASLLRDIDALREVLGDRPGPDDHASAPSG
jgi:hypothetical protein